VLRFRLVQLIPENGKTVQEKPWQFACTQHAIDARQIYRTDLLDKSGWHFQAELIVECQWCVDGFGYCYCTDECSIPTCKANTLMMAGQFRG
jgi:hypothetical protein